MKKTLSIVVLWLLVFNGALIAQTASAPVAEKEDMTTYYIILFAVFFLLLNAIFIPLLRESPVYGSPVAGAERTSVLKSIYDKLSGLKPMSQERELLMDEDYDGIAELDNNVPPWFNILFYATIVFAVFYMLNYHVFKISKLPFDEYSQEVMAADLQRQELIRTGAFINENTVKLQTDKEALNNGKQVFTANCVPCHGNNGEGTVGPNLTDDYWIHGGGIKNIFTVIKYGVPAKGMIAWQNQFNPKTMQDVASYVISLKGTNPPNGKAPEGQKYTETSADSAGAKTDSVKTSGDSLSAGKNAAADSLKRTDTTGKSPMLQKDTAKLKK